MLTFLPGFAPLGAALLARTRFPGGTLAAAPGPDDLDDDLFGAPILSFAPPRPDVADISMTDAAPDEQDAGPEGPDPAGLIAAAMVIPPLSARHPPAGSAL